MTPELSEVERAYALGDKETLEALQQAAENFKALEKNPTYREFVLRLQEAVQQMSEQVLSGVGVLEEKELLSKVRFRDGIKFVLDALGENLKVWDEATRYLELHQKEEEALTAESNPYIPESTL